MLVTVKRYLKDWKTQRGINEEILNFVKRQNELTEQQIEFRKLMVMHLQRVSKNTRLNRLEREEIDQFIKDNLGDHENL